jgi:protease I
MGKVAVILMDRFEDQDCLKLLEYLKRKGYELIHLGLRKGETVKGRRGATLVKIDQALDEVSADSFDALLIPRGYTLDGIRAAKGIVGWVENFLGTGRPVWRRGSNFQQGSDNRKNRMRKRGGV